MPGLREWMINTVGIDQLISCLSYQVPPEQHCDAGPEGMDDQHSRHQLISCLSYQVPPE